MNDPSTADASAPEQPRHVAESFLRREVRVIRRRARWLVLGCVGGAVGAFATTLIVKPPPPPPVYYKATETRVVATGSVVPGSSSLYDVNQVPSLLFDPAVVNEIAARAGVDPDVVPADLGVQAQGGLNAIDVVAVYGDAATAVKLAHVGAEVLSEHAQAVAAQRDQAHRDQLRARHDSLSALNAQLVAQREAEPQNADLIDEQIRVTSDSFTQVDRELSSLGPPMPFELTVLQPPRASQINARGAAVRRSNNLALRGGLPGVPLVQRSTQGELDIPTPKEFSPARRVGLGAAAGLLVGLFAALLAAVWDDRVRGRASLEDLPTSPLLAELPRLTRRQLRRFHSRSGGEDMAELREQFRSVRVATLFSLGLDPHAPGARPGKVVLVVSPNAREGRTTVVGGLARALADTSLRTLVIDGDLRHPSASRLVGAIPNLAAPDSPASTRYEGVDFLRSPRRDRPPTEVVRGVVESIQRRRDDYDVLLVDAAPLLLAFDASDYLAACADAAVIVWRDGWTTLEDAAKSIEIVEQFRVEIVGVVLNECEKTELQSWLGGVSVEDDETLGRFRDPLAATPAREG